MAMGNRNLERCLLCTPAITDIPARTLHCLLLMAKVAHDDAPLYWGGMTWLGMRLGYQPGPIARRETMRHLATLERAGYISRTSKRHGRRVVYELHLPTLVGPVDNQ